VDNAPRLQQSLDTVSLGNRGFFTNHEIDQSMPFLGHHCSIKSRVTSSDHHYRLTIVVFYSMFI
jgi:hypothetical protein